MEAVSTGVVATTSDTLDLTTVMKASQIISGEMEIASLLSKMIKIVIENAGAEKGCFILEKAGRLFIEAEGRISNGNIRVLQSIPLENADVPAAIVNYVARTREKVVLDDAVDEVNFKHSAYIREKKPKSVLCVPLVNQGKLAGIIYLENNAAKGAFTRNRVKVLELLAAQMAISLENATLYTNLESSEGKYRAIFENSGTALMFIEEDTTITMANKEFEKLTGYSKAEIEGQMSWTKIVANKADLELMLKYHRLRRVDQKESPQVYQFQLVDREGKLKHIVITVAVLPGKKQSLASLLDITERIRAEEALRKAHNELENKVDLRTQELTAANQELLATNEQLSGTLEELKRMQSYLVQTEKMAALGNLVAGMAHEINTPVGIGVTAASHLEQITRDLTGLYESGRLKRQDLVEYIADANEAAKIILANLERSAKLIKSFKQVSVDQSSEDRRLFNIKQYLDEILLSLYPKLKKTRHKITVCCDDSLEIDAFPGAFSQIMANLVMNSLIHAYGPADTGKIVINFREIDEKLVLTYSDDGKGMNKDVVSKVFEPFFTTKRGEGATGLGLHILYNIVAQQFGGTVECESEPGKGTTFIMTFPLRRRSNMKTGNEELFFHEEELKPTDVFLAKRGKWKILIVDDEEEVHIVTKLALKRLVFEKKAIHFLSAYSAAEVGKLLEENPDTAVILLDVVMEDDNAGLKLAHYIRKEMGNKLVRIILRTGYPGQAPEQSVIMDYDINDYKEKTDLTAQKLHTTVVAALRSFRDLTIIDSNRRGLQKIIESSASIFKLQSMSKFASGVLDQLVAILHLKPDALYCKTSSFAATKKDMEDFQVLAATGNYESLIGKRLKDNVSPELWQDIEAAFNGKKSLFLPDRFVIYSRSELGSENLIFLEGLNPLSEWERDMVDIFSLNVSVAFDNIYLNQEVEDTQKEIIFTLGEIAEARSLETGYHVKRVAELSKLLALKYGLTPDKAELLRLAAPTHDLGKLAIADTILKKPGKLTEEEFEIMKTHTVTGYEMLRKSNRYILQTAANIALQHHERYDGTGYPQGLKGEEIHIFGRIVGLTDVFDALGNERVYKKGWSLEEIVEYIRDQRGKHFDPALVDIFLKNLEEILWVRMAFPDR